MPRFENMRGAPLAVGAVVLACMLAEAGCSSDTDGGGADGGLDLPVESERADARLTNGGDEKDVEAPLHVEVGTGAETADAWPPDADAQDRDSTEGPDAEIVEPRDTAEDESPADVALECADGIRGEVGDVVDANLSPEIPTAIDGAVDRLIGQRDARDAKADDDGSPTDARAGEAFMAGVDGSQSVDEGSQGDGLEAAKDPIWVYLMAGQSNMVGVGTNDLLPREYASQVEGVSIYYDASIHPNTRTKRWLPLEPGFGATDNHFGPELAFGIRMHELYPLRKIAIIKVAEGGTGLYDRWQAGKGDLYDLLVSTIEEQLGVLAGQGRPQIVGLAWMQGETDALQLSTAKAYEQNLGDFISTLRSDVGSALMPAVFGLIATDAGWAYADLVRDATTKVANEQGRVEAIETDDLLVLGTEVAHYDTDGSFRLGWRFAEVIAAMQAKRWGFPADFAAIQGDNCWTYRAADLTGSVPLAYDEADGRWGADSSGPTIGQGWILPGDTQQAELSWWAPFAGEIEVVLKVAAPTSESDGIGIEVAHNRSLLLGPIGIHYPTSIWYPLKLAVVQGDEIVFRASAGPARDTKSDTTSWQIDITMPHPDE